MSEPTPTATPRFPVRGTALVGTATGATALLVGLADSARERDGVAGVDPHVATLVVQDRSASLTALAHALTWLGSEVVVGAVAVLVLALLLLRRQVFSGVVLALAMGGSAFLTVAVKLLVGRARPGAVDRLGPVDASYSFPSGHTLNTTVLLAVLVWLCWSRASRGRTALAAGAVALAVGVGASRIYLGYHWTTDVVASALVALAWLSVVALLAGPVRRVLARAPLPGRLGSEPSRRVA